MSTLSSALNLCSHIESFCPQYGCHVALTGGTLYKEGERKDVNILFYRIRQVEKIDVAGLIAKIEQEIGYKRIYGEDDGWVIKLFREPNLIDCFFPENKGNDYPVEEDEGALDALIELTRPVGVPFVEATMTPEEIADTIRRITLGESS